MKTNDIVKGFENGYLHSGIKVFCCLAFFLLLVGQVSATDVGSVTRDKSNNPQEEFNVYYQYGTEIANEHVYARGTTGATGGKLYVCKCEWQSTDALGQPKCWFVGGVTNDGSGGPGKFKIRVDDKIDPNCILPCECFDIVLDNNRNGVYDAGDNKDEVGTGKCSGCNPNANNAGFHFNVVDLNLWRHYGVGKVEFGKPSFN